MPPIFKQLLERPYKGAGVPRWLITASSAGLVDSRSGSILSYWTLRGTYMEGCYYSNSCSMDSTHSTWCKQKRDFVPGTGLLWTCLQVSSTRLAGRSAWPLRYVQACSARSPLSVVVITFDPKSLTGHLNATFVLTSFFMGMTLQFCL